MINRKKLILYTIIFIVVVSITAGTIYVLTRDDQQEESKEEEQDDIIISSEDIVKFSQTSIEVIKNHNTKEDCWVAKGDKVYELTSILLSLDGVEISDCGTLIEKELSKADLDQMDVYYITNLRKEDK